MDPGLKLLRNIKSVAFCAKNFPKNLGLSDHHNASVII